MTELDIWKGFTEIFAIGYMAGILIGLLLHALKVDRFKNK